MPPSKATEACHTEAGEYPSRMDGRAKLLLAAARCELGLAFTPDLVRAADEVLAAGLYTPAVHELSQQGEGLVHHDALVLLRRAVVEAGLAPVTRERAEWILVRLAVEAIAAGEPPRPHVDRVVATVGRDAASAGACDAARFAVINFVYDEPACCLKGEVELEFVDEAARLAHLDRRAREEARAWLNRHPV